VVSFRPTLPQFPSCLDMGSCFDPPIQKLLQQFGEVSFRPLVHVFPLCISKKRKKICVKSKTEEMFFFFRFLFFFFVKSAIFTEILYSFDDITFFRETKVECYAPFFCDVILSSKTSVKLELGSPEFDIEFSLIS